MYFVHRLKCQEVPFIFKAFCNLRPYSFQLGLDGSILAFTLGSLFYIQPITAVRPIVMNIDNGIQACVLRIAHYLGNTIQPCFLDLIAGSGSYMSHPSDRNTYGSDSCGSQFVKQGLRCLPVTPDCFISYAIAVRIQLISQIPAQSQAFGYSPGGLSCNFVRTGFSGLIGFIRFINLTGQLHDVELLFRQVTTSHANSSRALICTGIGLYIYRIFKDCVRSGRNRGHRTPSLTAGNFQRHIRLDRKCIRSSGFGEVQSVRQNIFRDYDFRCNGFIVIAGASHRKSGKCNREKKDKISFNFIHDRNVFRS